MTKISSVSITIVIWLNCCTDNKMLHSKVQRNKMKKENNSKLIKVKKNIKARFNVVELI